MDVLEESFQIDIPITIDSVNQENFIMSDNTLSNITPFSSTRRRNNNRLVPRRRSSLRNIEQPSTPPPPPPPPVQSRAIESLQNLNRNIGILDRRRYYNFMRRNAIIQTPPGLLNLQNHYLENEEIPENLSPVPIRATAIQIARATSRHRYGDISGQNEQELCPISQLNFQENDIVLRINCCGKIFGENEIISWLSDHVTCPCCRQDIREIFANRNRDSSIDVLN